MLTLLLGPDDFSKQEYISKMTQDSKSEAVFFDAENLPKMEELGGQDLFAKSKVFVLRGLVAKFNEPSVLDKLVASKNQIILIEEKLDKRLTANKDLLANKKIKVVEFALPHGRELNDWILNRVKALGGKISSQGAEALAVALGRDKGKETKFGGKVVSVEEVFNLWQADSEIKKLIAFASGKEISDIDVKELVVESGEVDVFDLTNAIAENQKQKAMELLHQFLALQSAGDEKASVIQLNALLAEQFRNVAAVQDFTANKISEEDILEKTGWKSGRLFVMKKAALSIPAKKILETLHKLSALDLELKTSQTPPKVLLDLIVSQLFV